MAGYQIGTACYSSPLEAREVIAAQTTGQIVQVGADPYSLSAYAQTDGIYILGDQLNGTGTFTKFTTAALPPCNQMDVTDGISMGWLVVAVWAVAYGITVLRRAL